MKLLCWVQKLFIRGFNTVDFCVSYYLYYDS